MKVYGVESEFVPSFLTWYKKYGADYVNKFGFSLYAVLSVCYGIAKEQTEFKKCITVKHQSLTIFDYQTEDYSISNSP